MRDQRWIVVADSPFLPATNGGQQEHLGFVRAASGEGLLALLVLPDGDTVDPQPYRDLLGDVPVLPIPRRRGPHLLLHPTTPYVVATRPAPPDLVARARDLAADATGIVVFSYKAREIGQVLAEGLGLPAVLRQHNREGAYHRSLARQTPGPRGWVYRWEARRIEADEGALARSSWLAGTADISLADAQWRRAAGGHTVVHVPPFARTLGTEPDAGPQPDAATQPAGVPPRVVFVGSLDVATNIGALQWFLGRVWPRVSAGHGEVVLDVVGRNPSPRLRALVAAAPRADLLADVPAIGPYLRRATVAVNPVVSGSGVNIKLVDYLDAGLPLVSTSLATAGLPLRPGVDLAVHDEPEAFAEAVLALLADPARARALAEAGRAHLAEILDPRRGLAVLADVLAGGDGTGGSGTRERDAGVSGSGSAPATR